MIFHIFEFNTSGSLCHLTWLKYSQTIWMHMDSYFLNNMQNICVIWDYSEKFIYKYSCMKCVTKFINICLEILGMNFNLGALFLCTNEGPHSQSSIDIDNLLKIRNKCISAICMWILVYITYVQWQDLFNNYFCRDVYIKDLSKFNVTGINADLEKMFVNLSIALESITISGMQTRQQKKLQMFIIKP